MREARKQNAKDYIDYVCLLHGSASKVLRKSRDLFTLAWYVKFLLGLRLAQL